MASTLQSLLSRFFPPAPLGRRVVLSGSDSAGKTTFLYLLRLGEILQFGASIGVNVESVLVPLPFQPPGAARSSSVHKKGDNLDLVLWDLGQGCSRGSRWMVLMNMRLYLANASALIWFVDASKGEEELKESAETLGEVMQLWDGDLWGGDLPILM